jgi:peptidoglycan/LPS O-acetylase OafA/YrhL
MLERCGIFRLGKWAAWAGAVSYPLYISHSPLLNCLDAIFPPPLRTNILVEAGSLILVYGVAIGLAFAVDRPLQRRLRKVYKNA